MTEPVFNPCRQVFMSALQQFFQLFVRTSKKPEVFTKTDPANDSAAKADAAKYQ